jgi:hypothetical protein
MSKSKFVVVCTEKRGVFGGMVEDTTKDPIVMKDAQMCVYWDAGTRGVVGLAATGPTDGCRITKPAPSSELHGITAVFDATDDAADAWRSCPWG